LRLRLIHLEAAGPQERYEQISPTSFNSHLALSLVNFDDQAQTQIEAPPDLIPLEKSLASGGDVDVT
jgi:hypothetical protein